MAKLFAAQMYAVGLSTVFLFPVGSGGMQDKLHSVFAGLYFIYHIVLFKYLKTTRPYQIGFYLSFGTFLYALKRVRNVETKYDFRAESNASSSASAAAPSKTLLPSKVVASLWWNEVVMMFSENTMFISFLLGMTSSLQHLLKR